MTVPRSRALLVASIAVLAAVLAAWAWWPSGDGSADLVSVAPIPTTEPTTTSTTAVPATPAPTAVTTTVPPPPPQITTPTRLRVPSIGIDAPVVPVALRPDGQMEVPAATDVGWYRLGPAPGAGGSAVLAAHVDQGGQRGAFFDLRSVPVGAEVVVEGDGGARSFTVTAREQVAKDAVQLDRYFTAAGPSRLTLITCGGVFDRSIGHYQDNIILTAEPTPGAAPMP